MRFLIVFIALTVWCGFLMVLAKSGIEISDNIIAIITSVIVSVVLAGGNE